MAEIFVYEFLFRGKPAAEIKEAAWHVVLGASEIDIFGKPHMTFNGPLNMEQAAKAGYPLPTLIDMINGDLLQQAEVLKTSVKELEGRVAATADQLQATTNELSATADQLATVTADHAAVSTQLDEARKIISNPIDTAKAAQ